MLRKFLRRAPKVFLGLVVFWFLVHLVENWRGKRAWESWKAEQVAKGAHYQIEALLPPPMPDVENFAKAPIIESATRDGGRLLGKFSFGGPSPFPPGWETGHILDLNAWSKANTTNDLETTLAATSKALDQISEAAKRKGCRFDIPRNDENFFGIQFLGYRAVGRVLTIRSLLLLRSGRMDAALQDVCTQLRIIRHLSHEPELMVELSQLAMSGFALQAVWEGLETHAWNETQLKFLQNELMQIDELTPLLIVGNDQRISASKFYGKATSGKLWEKDSSTSGKIEGLLALGLIPRGWMYQNWRRADEHFATTWLMAVDPSKHMIYPDRVREIETWWEEKRSTPYTFFAKMLAVAGPGMTSQAHRFAERQVAIDEGIVVCALERYRMAHGDYPDTIQALVPDFAAKLPDDVFTGLPLRYKHIKKGGFLLYSVGWNGIDEGGQMVLDNQNPPRQNREKGDWPWPRFMVSQPTVKK